MRLACADFSFPLLPLDAALALIASLRLQGLDLGLFESRGALQPSTEFLQPTRSGARLHARLDLVGLRLADVFIQGATDFSTLAVNHPDRQVRRRVREIFRRGLDYVQAARGRHITMLPGVHWPRESIDSSLRRSADELTWYAATARSAGVTFAVEPHLGSVIARPVLAQRLVELAPGLTLTLDYGHFIYQGIPPAAIHPLFKHTSHFHARGAARGRLQAAMAHSTIDFSEVLQAMRSHHYTGWIGLEYVWIDWEHCNEVDNLSETILMRNHLKRLHRRP